MNLSNGLLFLLLVSVSPLLAHPFASWHTWQSLGVQQSFTFGPSHESSTLGYVSAGATGKWKGFDVDLGLRAESYGGLRSSRLEILSASLAKSYGPFQLRMGWQKIAWGETFGFYIADLVNPRDYSNPWLNDIDWMRLSVPALQFKWLGDALSIETVLTPIPRRPLLPNQKQVGLSRDFAIPLEGYPEYPHERKLQSMEGGARIGYLTSWGTDFSLIGYRHWNRNLVYEASFASGAFSLNPVLHRTTTWGVCASHAFEAIVLRMDSVYHIKQPWASRFYGLITRQNVWETVVGADYTLEDGSIALCKLITINGLMARVKQRACD